MAAYISVPRDLSKVKSKIFFNLTKRQLICFSITASNLSDQLLKDIREQIAAEETAEKAKTEQADPQPTEPAEQEPEQKSSKLPYAIGLIILIGACGVGGAFLYLKNKKSQAESAERPDPDADYREDDDGYDIPEESEEEKAEDFNDEEE